MHVSERIFAHRRSSGGQSRCKGVQFLFSCGREVHKLVYRRRTAHRGSPGRVIDSTAWPRRRTRLAKGNPQGRRRGRSAARPHAGRRRNNRASVRARKRWSEPRAALRCSPLSMSPRRRGDGVSARIPLDSRAIPKGCRMRRGQIPRAWKSSWRKARTSRRGW